MRTPASDDEAVLWCPFRAAFGVAGERAPCLDQPALATSGSRVALV